MHMILAFLALQAILSEPDTHDLCPKVSATLFSRVNGYEEPEGKAERFELRRCPGGAIQVLGWQQSVDKPSLVSDIGDAVYQVLYHKFNILVMQTLGGASDHVYVFTFESGIPKLALQSATKDEISVHSEGDFVVVEVPPVTYPNSKGVFPPTPISKKYRFKSEP